MFLILIKKNPLLIPHRHSRAGSGGTSLPRRPLEKLVSAFIPSCVPPPRAARSSGQSHPCCPGAKCFPISWPPGTFMFHFLARVICRRVTTCISYVMTLQINRNNFRTNLKRFRISVQLYLSFINPPQEGSI